MRKVLPDKLVLFLQYSAKWGTDNMIARKYYLLVPLEERLFFSTLLCGVGLSTFKRMKTTNFLKISDKPVSLVKIHMMISFI